MESIRRTVAQLVADRWDDHRPGLWFEEQVLTHHEVAAGAAARAALLADLLPPTAEPHLGVLLDNTPEFPLWLSAAALAGAAVAGVNPTRRGPELARDILHTECRLLITEQAHLPLLDGLDLTGVRILVTDTRPYTELLAPYAGARPDPTRAGPADRLLLYFTSGSTGAPKAALCSQGRLAAAGRALVDRFGIRRDDVHYVCMPLFHGNAVIADWAPALVAGAGIALRRRFSASGFLDDVRAYGATYFTYVGRAVSYVLATEPRPDDRDNPLRMGFGTEAGAVDAAAFEERFGVRLVEGYGSSEGGAAIQRTPGTPPGAIGRAAPGDDLAVVDPETRKECPPALLADDGRLLNGTEAIGELVNRGPNPFEGYWRNPEADTARRHDGWYWTGDLFYRDPDGFLYFAGRTDDRLRVDSENLAAAVIENILARYEGAEAVAVYAVPDPVAGDQVMATVAGAFDPDGFAEFLVAQPDLGTKMTPRFVRVVPSMPVTATNKIQRATLRREGFRCADPVWWRPPGKWAYRKFSAVDLARLVAEYRARGRDELLTR
ncbi:long-chain-fatty-acid--CoA ligase [Streptomyces scabiei]|uniref:long-chain-fatty-acid--CoA ligase n=3 Tax=Streptomyces scabiei TaxID=1930 RepID=UPI0004E764EB|nr:long-chain-fatty-acid--CoA ligase [Streptomyces scabiei]KFG03388.1 acyl-CoA synthetase [Streptomyces scabiei]MBP5931295.1 AMP-binding protein [Streptomyces sp. LBUM 1479]MDX2834887.1 long-chain-fatty-acid--CoA ligase [Streptomyces scabiei]MDX3675857.1 long-chain-fatty-acid--CoA ligase [Streptomyces scabiei]